MLEAFRHVPQWMGILVVFPVQGYSPDRLMQVELPILDNDVCNQPEFLDGSVDDTMVCAGTAQGGVGACHVSAAFGIPLHI